MIWSSFCITQWVLLNVRWKKRIYEPLNNIFVTKRLPRANVTNHTHTHTQNTLAPTQHRMPILWNVFDINWPNRQRQHTLKIEHKAAMVFMHFISDQTDKNWSMEQTETSRWTRLKRATDWLSLFNETSSSLVCMPSVAGAEQIRCTSIKCMLLCI